MSYDKETNFSVSFLANLLLFLVTNLYGLVDRVESIAHAQFVTLGGRISNGVSYCKTFNPFLNGTLATPRTRFISVEN